MPSLRARFYPYYPHSAPSSTVFESIFLALHTIGDLPAKHSNRLLKYSISLGWESSKGTAVIHRYGALLQRSFSKHALIAKMHP